MLMIPSLYMLIPCQELYQMGLNLFEGNTPSNDPAWKVSF